MEIFLEKAVASVFSKGHLILYCWAVSFVMSLVIGVVTPTVHVIILAVRRRRLLSGYEMDYVGEGWAALSGVILFLGMVLPVIIFVIALGITTLPLIAVVALGLL